MSHFGIAANLCPNLLKKKFLTSSIVLRENDRGVDNTDSELSERRMEIRVVGFVGRISNESSSVEEMVHDSE